MGFLKFGKSKKDNGGAGAAGDESPAPPSRFVSTDRPGSARGGLSGGGGDYGQLVHGAVLAGNSAGEETILVESVSAQARPETFVVEGVARSLLDTISNGSPDISTRALLLLDKMQVTGDPNFLRAISKTPWLNVYHRIATNSLDPVHKEVVLQLLADWANAASPPHSEFKHAYQSTIQALAQRGVQVPAADPGRTPGARSARGGGGGGGDVFMPPVGAHPPSAGAAPSATAAPPANSDFFGSFTYADQMSAIEERTSNHQYAQIKNMHEDIQLLNAAINAGGKQACSEGDEIWDAAERCKGWQNKVQDMLMQDLSEDLLCKVLEGNDNLNMVLYKWQMSGSEENPELMDLMSPTQTEFVPTSAGAEDPFGLDPFALPAGGNGGGVNPFAGMGSGMGISAPQAATSAASGGTSSQEVAMMKSELGRIRQQLAASEGKVEEARVRLQGLTLANTRLEDDLAKANARMLEVQAESMEAAAAAAAGQGKSAEETERAQAAQAKVSQLQQQVQELTMQKAEVEKQLRQVTAEKADIEAKLMEAETKMSSTMRRMAEMQVQVQQSQQMHEKLAALEKQAHSHALELKKEAVLRKKAMNELRALKGNIRVCARVRPAGCVGTSGDNATDVALSIPDEYTVELATQGRGSSASDTTMRKYEFDNIFGPDSTQQQIYEEARDLLQQSMDGFNVCLFAYGQTGSGKTHTILGSKGDDGILPRVIADLYNFSKYGGLQNEVKVHCYMLELYQDNLNDLFAPNDNKKLEIRRDPGTGIVSVEGAKVLPAADATELRALLDKGLTSRKMASTKMNDQSSRSHLIFSMLVQNHVPATNTTTSGKLTFVDLAGSERVARSGAINDDQRLKEAQAINKSLSALGDVVAALTTNTSFVPYRNHKLTQLMSDSLGGNAKCCMVVNVSPLTIDADETRNSLDYASRVKNVTNEASKSMETKEISRLKAIIAKMGGNPNAGRPQSSRPGM